MSGHSLKFTFDGWLNVQAVCHEPAEADCKLQSAGCECEEWGSIWTKEDGTIWHRVIGEGPMEPVWHQVNRSEQCNVCDWLNTDDVLELAVQGLSFDIAEIPIKAVVSPDGIEWEPLP